MNLSELAGRPVLDLAAVTDVGDVADFVIESRATSSQPARCASPIA